MDDASQVRNVTALAIRDVIWLRDEEASYPDLADWLGGWPEGRSVPRVSVTAPVLTGRAAVRILACLAALDPGHSARTAGPQMVRILTRASIGTDSHSSPAGPRHEASIHTT